MDEAEYQAYYAHWAQEIINLCREALPNLGYEETKSLAVQVVLENNLWKISDDSMATIDQAIIAYP